MKRQYCLLLLFVFVFCSSVIDTNCEAGEEPSGETENAAPSQGLPIFSQLFPIRGRIYPNYNPIGIKSKPYSDAGYQYTAKKYLDNDYLGGVTAMFSPNSLPKDMSVIYIPVPEGDVPEFPGRRPRFLVSFYLDEVNVTVIWIGGRGGAVAITFEYDESPEAPKKLAAVHQELSRLLQVMNHLVLDYNIPKNKDIYQGKDFDESKLYYAEANKEKVPDPMWVRSVRWWRGYGRFGISYTDLPSSYFEMPPPYVMTPDPYGESFKAYQEKLQKNKTSKE